MPKRSFISKAAPSPPHAMTCFSTLSPQLSADFVPLPPAKDGSPKEADKDYDPLQEVLSGFHAPLGGGTKFVSHKNGSSTWTHGTHFPSTPGSVLISKPCSHRSQGSLQLQLTKDHDLASSDLTRGLQWFDRIGTTKSEAHIGGFN